MSKKVTKLGSGYYFNCFAMKTIIALLKNKVIEENNVHLEYYKPKHKTFILICNHTEAADPGYEMAALKKYVRFIASDHTLRMSLGWAFKLFGGVIIKYRDRPSQALMDDIKANLKAGIPVGLHAEGAMSLNGHTGYFSDNTGKLVKESGAALVTYKFVGGYLRSPRWANKSRKGPIIGHFVGEYSPEELSKMSVEEINELIRRDIRVNVYEEQRKEPHSYDGEDLAECVERILYMCPKCGQVGTLHSKGDDLKCDCGAVYTMKADGFFHGDDVVYDNVYDWDMWQRKQWKEKLFSAADGELIFSEGGQIVRLVKEDEDEVLSENATLSLYKDRFEIAMEDKTIVMPVNKVKQSSLASKETLFLVDDEMFLDIRSQIPRAPTKYIAAWRYLNGKEYY
ncbi:MAG: 1-acyl-sn-glycerol-3-phosphate acyltransferase [Clostridia bacterium]|nr:1-acyl-sn-glycerol-3-phosphate acyltransferase [Clostridia bacterium]